MYAVFVFETREFIERTKPLFTSSTPEQGTFVGKEYLDDWYDWMIGYILRERFYLPVSNKIDVNKSIIVLENMFLEVEVQVMRAFQSVITPEERTKIPMFGTLKYLFTGKQLFIFTCSPV